MNYDKEISKTCWVAKALAILFVIIAHSNFNEVSGSIIYYFLKRLGSMAVPLFLIISGRYYNVKKYNNLLELINYKIKNIVIPWLFCGIFIYVYSSFKSTKDISIYAGIKFLLGVDTYLYFLSVLILLNIMYWFVKKYDKRKVYFISFIINIISLILTITKISDPLINYIQITNYLNPFNWIAFFSFGIAMRDYDIKKFILDQHKCLCFILIWIILFISGYLFDDGYGYFSVLGFTMEWMSSFILLYISWNLRNFIYLQELGKYSFAIYLTHIEIIPIVFKFLHFSVLGTLISPFIVYFINFILLYVIKKGCEKIKNIKLIKLFGLR